jgi:hypothetical protein
MRHRTPGIDTGDLPECLASLRIGHVMQQGGGMIECLLGFRRAADRKIHDPEGIAVVLLAVGACRDAAEQSSGQYDAMDQRAPSIRHRATLISRDL